MSKYPHIGEAIRRNTGQSTLLLVAMFLIVFGPRIWDTFTGQPSMENTLSIVLDSTGDVLIHDLTLTQGPVHGVRANTIETEDGSVVCSTEHHNSWRGERNRFWRVSAFVSCDPPAEPYRICSTFSVESESGRHRFLGPFCSALSVPPEEIVASPL